MWKTTRSAILPVLAVAFIGFEAGADDLEIVKIKEITCRMYLKMNGEERDLTAVFMHGYVSAMKSETNVNLVSISEANDKIIDNCIDQPSSLLLEVFKTNRS